MRGVHAAVVELDPLADPVRPRPEDDHARAVVAGDLVPRRRALVGGVVVGGLGRELGRAGVDRAVGPHAALRPLGVERELLQLAQEPRVDRRARPRLGRRRALPEGLEQHVVAVGAGRLQPREQVAGEVGGRVELARAQRLGERLLEGAADRHHLADRLHVRRQPVVDAGELLEREARPLDDDVVDRRLEGGRRAPRDVVRDLVERVADCQPRGDLGDREARRLGGQRRGARHARVHLDDDDLVRRGVDRELHVGAARLHADGADDRDRLVAQRWYSRSESDICGATVTESPVCTPIGSTFSIEQTTTTLSAPSRMTSSSNSPQPSTDSSISTCPIGEAARPRATIAASSASARAIPPPRPPSVKAGRIISGSPTASAPPRLLEAGGDRVPRQCAGPPLASWPRSARGPRRSDRLDGGADQLDAEALQHAVLVQAMARFSAVCPPSVGSSASGRSRSITRATTSGRSGST